MAQPRTGSCSLASESASIRFDDGSVGPVSLLGMQFAEFVALKAYATTTHAQVGKPKGGARKGNNSGSQPSPIKHHEAFKPPFFMDPKYNPAISNTHLCYEYDAHYKDAENDWSRAGKKFSDEPRIGKPPSSDQGPMKWEELPQYCEKEQLIFGKKRQLRPFFRAQQYTRPVDRCTIPYRPTRDDETSHLGPGAYLVPDPWRAKTGHGNIYGTHPLLSNAKGRGDFDTVLPPKKSLSHLQLTGSVEVRSKSPKAALRKITSGAGNFLDHDHHQSQSGVTIGPRPSTNNAPVRQLSMVSTPCMTLTHDESFAFACSEWDFDKDGHGGNVCGRAATAFPSSRSNNNNLKNQTGAGFRFSKATFSTSSIDVTTGTTNADVLYRRIKLKDGASRIYAVSKNDNQTGESLLLPKGSVEAPSWATEPLRVDESLAVVSGLVSPMGAKTYSGYLLDPPPPLVLSGRSCPPITFANLTQASIDDSRVSIPGSSGGPVLSYPRNSPFRPPSVLKEKRTKGENKLSRPVPMVAHSKFSVRAADILGLGDKRSNARGSGNDVLGAVISRGAISLNPSLVESIESNFHP